jgi:hypothetical protein
VSREVAAITAALTGSLQKSKIYGGVMMKEKRTWEFDELPPTDLRQDVGIGHMLHWVEYSLRRSLHSCLF